LLKVLQRSRSDVGHTVSTARNDYTSWLHNHEYVQVIILRLLPRLKLFHRKTKSERQKTKDNWQTFSLMRLFSMHKFGYQEKHKQWFSANSYLCKIV
jgi:hypothetical protein